MLSSFYRYISSNQDTDMQDVDHIARQLRQCKSLVLVGGYPRENFDGISFFWMKRVVSIHYATQKGQRYKALFSFPKGIISKEEINDRLSSASIKSCNGQIINVERVQDFGDRLLTNFDVPEGSESINIEFSDFINEAGGMRQISLPVKTILLIKRDYLKELTQFQVHHCIETESLPADKGVVLFSEHQMDATASYFTNIMDGYSNEE